MTLKRLPRALPRVRRFLLRDVDCWILRIYSFLPRAFMRRTGDWSDELTLVHDAVVQTGPVDYTVSPTYEPIVELTIRAERKADVLFLSHGSNTRTAVPLTWIRPKLKPYWKCPGCRRHCNTLYLPLLNGDWPEFRCRHCHHVAKVVSGNGRWRRHRDIAKLLRYRLANDGWRMSERQRGALLDRIEYHEEIADTPRNFAFIRGIAGTIKRINPAAGADLEAVLDLARRG
jgi:hypothetical protein